MFACSRNITYWPFTYVNARLYLFLVEKAYRVWGATIFSYTAGKETPYISYRIYYLKEMNDPLMFPPLLSQNHKGEYHI